MSDSPLIHKAPRYLVSWTFITERIWSGSSRYVQGWAEISPILFALKDGAGTVGLDLIDAPDPGPASMQVAAAKKNYLVTLFETTEDDSCVRSYTNTCAAAEMVDILGDFWDLILRLFQEFCDTGDVSRQWLS